MQRRWILALAGAGTAITAAGLSVVLVVLLGNAAPAVPGRLAGPAWHASVPPQPPPRPTGPLVSPFTGERIKALRPVLVVKIDNIVYARPPRNLTSADIVYVLPVEGGLSRIFAVFSSHIPTVIGPVRSAREDDLELLRQFGTPAFAYSGATPVLLPYIARHARVVNLYDTPAYFRDYSRVAPYNLYANPRMLQAEAPKASIARDIGFRFGPPPPGGRPMTSFSVSYPAASFTFRWSARSHRWLVWMDGTLATDAAGGDLGGSTVVIQYTVVGKSRFLEYGFAPPYAVSAGSGTALVLRDGRAYQVRWTRSNVDGGTTYTLPSGARMTFEPGQVWVVLTTTNWARAGL